MWTGIMWDRNSPVVKYRTVSRPGVSPLASADSRNGLAREPVTGTWPVLVATKTPTAWTTGWIVTIARASGRAIRFSRWVAVPARP